MAVAEKPSPPSPPAPLARTILAPMLAFVPFVLAPMLALARVVLVAGRALPYLCFAAAWVLSAIGAARVVAHLSWGQGSAPFAFLQALTEVAVKVSSMFILAALASVLLCDRFLIEFASDSDSELKKSAFEAIMKESTQGLSRCFPVMVLGLAAILACLPLIVAGTLVMMMSSRVEGSTSLGETIGSVIVDVGLFGPCAISCFVIFPAMLLSVWRKDQADKKEPSQFC